MKTLLLFLVGVFCLAGYSVAPVGSSDICEPAGISTKNLVEIKTIKAVAQIKTVAGIKPHRAEGSLALDIGLFGIGAAMLSQSGNF